MHNFTPYLNLTHHISTGLCTRTTKKSDFQCPNPSAKSFSWWIRTPKGILWQGDHTVNSMTMINGAVIHVSNPRVIIFQSMIMQQIACLQLVTLTSSTGAGWGRGRWHRAAKPCMVLDDPDDPGNLMNLGSDNPVSNPELRAQININSSAPPMIQQHCRCRALKRFQSDNCTRRMNCYQTMKKLKFSAWLHPVSCNSWNM